MTQQSFNADLSVREIPFNFSELGSTIIIDQGTEVNRHVPGSFTGRDPTINAGIPQAYYLNNVMPLSRGFGSIALTQAIQGIEDLGENVIHSFVVHGPQNSISLFVATETKAYIYDPNGGEWIELELPYAAPDRISYAYLKEQTYIHYGYGVYVYDFTAKELTPVEFTGIVTAALDGITSAGSFLIAWDGNTVYRSSVLDPLDFDPSRGLETGAGATGVLALKGRIVACLAMGQDFVIYTTKNAVSARFTGNIQSPFVYNEIPGSAGIQSLFNVAYNSNSGSHIVWTASGFQEVTVQSAEYIWPELGDGIIRGIKTTQSEVTGVPKFEYIEKYDVRLSFISNRWLAVSTRELASDDPNFYDCYVWDLVLGRWGKLHLPHRAFIEYNIPEVFETYTYDAFAVDYETYDDIPENLVYGMLDDSSGRGIISAGFNFGIVQNDGKVIIASWSETADFRGDIEIYGATKPWIILGKFKVSRNYGVHLHWVKTWNLIDAAVYAYGHDYTGKIIFTKTDFVQNTLHPGQYIGTANADAVSIGISGQFVLTQLSLMFSNAGRVNQRAPLLKKFLYNINTVPYPVEALDTLTSEFVDVSGKITIQPYPLDYTHTSNFSGLTGELRPTVIEWTAPPDDVHTADFSRIFDFQMKSIVVEWDFGYDVVHTSDFSDIPAGELRKVVIHYDQTAVVPEYVHTSDFSDISGELTHV